MLGRGGDHQNSYSRIEYFLMLFPPRATTANTTIDKPRTGNGEEDVHIGRGNCKVLWGNVTGYTL